jgi:hypothetical protein
MSDGEAWEVEEFDRLCATKKEIAWAREAERRWGHYAAWVFIEIGRSFASGKVPKEEA